MKRSQSLRSQVLTGLGLLMVVVLAIGYLAVSVILASFRRDIEARNLTLAETMASRLRFVLIPPLDDAIQAYRDNPEKESEEVIRRLAQAVLFHGFVKSVYMLDEANRVYDTVPLREDLVGLDFSRLVPATLDSKHSGPEWSDASISPEDGRQTVVAGVRIGRKTLLINCELDGMVQMVQSQASSRMTSIAVLDQKGKVITHSGSGLNLQGANLGPIPPIRRALQGESSSQEATFDQMAWLVAASPVENPPWVVAVLQSEDEAFKVVNNAHRTWLGSLLVVSVATILALLWFGRCHRREIQSVTQSLSRVAEGRYGTGFETVYQEYQQLAEAFSSMAEKLAQRENDLKNSEARLRTLFETMAEGVVVRDRNGIVTQHNSAATEILGHDPSKVGGAGQPARRRFYDENGSLLDLDETPPAVAFRESRAVRGKILGIEQEDRSIVWVVSNAIPEIDEAGEVVRVVTTISDITPLKRAEQAVREMNTQLEERVRQRTQELELSNKELESFAYSVAHDLRAPLRAIDGFSNALVEDYAEVLGPDGLSDLNRVRLAAQRMGHLIDDLLALSRVTRATINPTEVDLTAIAQAIAEELNSDNQRADLEWNIEPGLTAHGDEQLLRTALYNLMSNAFKFTGKAEHAKIEVGSHTKNGQTVFFVKDNGAGFDPKYSDKLFRIFERLHDAREFDGTGVGLAIVQRVVARHNGRVWGEGAPGKGATFSFTIGKPNGSSNA